MLFLTSPGFGGLAALAAALLAYRGIRIRLQGDQQLAQQARLAADQSAERNREIELKATLENDARNRWWALATWIDQQIGVASLPTADLLELLERLGDAVTTSEQSVMVESLVRKVIGGDRT